MTAIVEEDGTYGRFTWIETGDGLVVFDEQGPGLEEFFGVRYGTCLRSSGDGGDA